MITMSLIKRTITPLHAPLVFTLAVGAGAIAIFATPRVALAQENAGAAGKPEPDVIVTAGDGIVRIAPDQAFVSITAESHAKLPREASRLNAEAMTAVQQKLKAAGFSGDDVRTLQLELQPQYDYANGKQTLREYVARNTIEVRVEPVERLGEVTDLSVGSGATSVSNIRFELKNRRAMEQKALQEAVAEARARADAIAQSANRAIDRILRVEDAYQESPPMPRPMMAMVRGVAAEAQAVTPVAAGLLEIRAHVSLTVKMR
jgi:uncharacterized protein